jgi:hypothetical protein
MTTLYIVCAVAAVAVAAYCVVRKLLRDAFKEMREMFSMFGW